MIAVSVATNGGSNQNLRVGLSVGGKKMKYGDNMELTCGVFFEAVFFIRGEADSVPDSYRRAIHRCSDEMLFRKNSLNSQENIWTGAYTFTKKGLYPNFFPVNFTKPFRTPLLLNTCKWLLQQRPGNKRAKSKYYQIFHWCKKGSNDQALCYFVTAHEITIQ